MLQKVATADTILMRRPPSNFLRRGFTLIELWVVMAILCILVALLLPALKAARDEAQRVVCMSNLKQMHLGFYLYAEDYEDYLPIMWWGPTQDDFSKHWMFKIEPYIQKIRPGVWGGDVFKCPSAPQLPSSTYFTYTANLILGYRVAGYVPHHKKTSSFVEPAASCSPLTGGSTETRPGGAGIRWRLATTITWITSACITGKPPMSCIFPAR